MTVGTLRVEPPLVNGSGVVDATSSDQGWNLPDATLSKLGWFTTKTITAAPRPGSPQPWAEVLAPGTLANAAGLPNPGIDRVLVDWAELPGRLGVPVVASIGGSVADMPDLARRLAQAGWVAGIELNLSCPNVAGGLVAGDAAATHDAVARVRAQVGALPLVAKLTPACGNPGEVARAAQAAGADALTCGNTMPVRVVVASGQPVLGAGPHGGMSGTGLHHIALRLVAEVAQACEVPVVGLGGVDGTAAARRMLDAGAAIVGVGTGAVFEPGLVDELATMVTDTRASTPG